MNSRLFLLSELIRRDLATRYAGSFAGVAWALLNPLLLCLIYAVVFGQFLKIPAPSGFRWTYAEFLLAGLLPWIGFQEAISRGTASVTDQAHLVKKLPFPPELLVLSTIGSAQILQLGAMSVLAAWAGLTGRGSIHPGLLAAGFALEILVLAGPVFALAALQVFFRDLSQLIAPLLMVAFYLTPILYPAEQIPNRYAPLLALNPLADIASLFRAGLYGTPPPSLLRLGVTTATCAALAFAGRLFFKRCRGSFSDLL